MAMTDDAPSGLIELVSSVMAAVGSPGPWFIERVPTGRSNFVYRVADQRGRAYAVRVGRSGPSRFPAEYAAMQAADRVGVPTAAVRHVGEVVHAGVSVPIMVTDWVEAPLLRAAITPGTASRGFISSLARTLADIHSVSVGGYGRLDADLSSGWQAFDRWFVDDLGPALDASAIAVANDPILGSDPEANRLIDRGYQHLIDCRGALAGADRSLAHGDISPDNLLVDLTRSEPGLSVVLDWESAKGGHPGLDFGWWDYIGGAAVIPTEDLIDAYEAEIGLAVEDLALIRSLVRIRILLVQFGWLGRSALIPPSLVPTARALAAELDGVS